MAKVKKVAKAERDAKKAARARAGRSFRKVAKAELDAKKAARARAGRSKNQKASDIPKTSIFSASSLDILTSVEGGSTHGMQSEKEESTNESHYHGCPN